MKHSSRKLVVAVLVLGLGLSAQLAFAAESRHLGARLDGPIHTMDRATGEVRIEALDAYRVAVAVDRSETFAAVKEGVDYYAVFTAKDPIENAPSFWGQATVEFREDVLLIGPTGDARLFAFSVDRKGTPTRDDIVAEFPTVDLALFAEGGSLLYRKAPAGMTLGQLNAVAREASVSPPLDFFLQQTEGDGSNGGCARSCSMTCIDGSECEISCGTGLCASCSCENGTLTCKCR